MYFTNTILITDADIAQAQYSDDKSCLNGVDEKNLIGPGEYVFFEGYGHVKVTDDPEEQAVLVQHGHHYACQEGDHPLYITTVFKCPFCGQKHAHAIPYSSAQKLRENVPAQHALPEGTSSFEVEAYISYMCYDCQSRVFNRPKPGEDWGELLGECEECGCPIWDHNKGKCPQCGTEFTKDTCGCDKCQACENTSPSTAYGDHVCRCHECVKNNRPCKHSD